MFCALAAVAVAIAWSAVACAEVAFDMAASATWRAWARLIFVSASARFWPSISTFTLHTSLLWLSGFAQYSTTVMLSGICWHAVVPAAAAVKINADAISLKCIL